MSYSAQTPLSQCAYLCKSRMPSSECKRLNTMLQAVKMVSSALNDFYGTMSDEQKARFEAIGPQRTTQLESLEVTHTNVRRRGPPSAEQIIRRLISSYF